ncbi:MAG TPA: hypothetical protein VNY27_04340 [Solirubrobacteraceae bacterium]|nr:hypothetical protein [Solirubrobacteraceae bacterium]
MLLLLWLVVPAGAIPSKHPFEIIPGSFHFIPSTLQAGAHGDLTTSFDFAHNASGNTFNDVRTIVVNVPAGFTANNTAAPTCSDTQLASLRCPPATTVGRISLTVTGETYSVPLENMEVTSPGIVAEFGFHILAASVLMPITIRPGDDGITVTTPNIVNIGEPRNISVTVWGLPASPEHDAERQLMCEGTQSCRVCLPNTVECSPAGPVSVGIAVVPYLSNPTSCGSFTATMQADSWEEPFLSEPERWSQALFETGPIGECDRVPFDPSIKVQPTTNAAESSSGLNVSLEVPQSWENPYSIATSNVRDVTVTLPRGYTINPSEGNGLVGCTPQQYARETASSGPQCPPESKLGTVVIETPVLADRIEGNVYIAQPYDNVPSFGDAGHPGGSLLALYVVAKDPARGIVVKSAGKVIPDPVTGQLTSTFEGLPQQPFTKVTLSLAQGAASPLVSPPACGRYTAHAAMTPYSAPEHPSLVDNELEIERGIGGGPCPPGGVPPFNPTVITGAQNNNAGGYTPFYLRINRNDGEQELTRFSTTLPPGLTGNLSGIPFCPDAQIEAARHATGRQELSEPSCPVASKVGHTLVGAGVGSVLAWTPGSVYLAGPYHGAPFSIVSVTSATVGPFDLGTVVIRFALRINPITAQVEVDARESDPIPHIIKGIVVHVRDIHTYIDLPNFIKNPTSCDPMTITDTVTGAGADFTNPADQVPVTINTPFQAADCSNLGFKPSFKVTTSGKTSKANGASLNVKLAYPNAPQGSQANIHRVKVDLPKQLPSRLTTLQKACTAAQFHSNPAGCPAASVVGHARAITPILPVPLEGPAYFVSNGGEAFPNLIIVLQGYGVTIDLVGDTFISKQGITSSTFKTVPDQPVTSFELTLPQGPFSALTANGNLCALTRTVLVKKKVKVRTRGRRRTITRRVRQTLPASLSMPTEFVAQNGATLHQNTTVSVTGCAKAKPAKKTKKHEKRK